MIGRTPTKRKSALTLHIERKRDEMPMTVGCTIEGCGWPGWTGPAGEAREIARGHRVQCHPDRPVVAKRPKPPPKVRHEQNAEDKRIVAELAKRQSKRGRTGTRNGRYRRASSTLSRAQVEELYVNQGMSAREVAGELGCWPDTVRHALKVYEIPQRPHKPRSWSYVTPEREARAWEVYERGHTAREIADLIWEQWGYSTVRQCQRSIYEAFNRNQRMMRPALRRRKKMRREMPALDHAAMLAVLEPKEEEA